MVLAIIENIVEIELSIAKLNMPAPFEILYENDMWIGDTGALSHLKNNKLGASNKRYLGSASLGYAGKALKATSTIHVAGRFVEKDGTLGLKAFMTEVNFNEKLNFNLISPTQLLCNGWTITMGNATGILLTNGNGGEIKFNIVVSMAHGAIFACHFVQNVEVSATSTDVGAKMSIFKAHGLLGHGNEEPKRATAWELGWILA